MLVRELEALTLLDNRYSDIKLVNMPAGVKRGHFSLVFKAFDQVTQKNVALKFFDLDPAKHSYYRLQCFDREHSILRTLVGSHRCLQVASPIGSYDLQIPVPGHTPVSLFAKYFAVEWIEEEIDGYFLRQEHHEAIDKLALFLHAMLGVESLHAKRIFHRDLKADNFRSTGSGPSREVIAIDLGTAAELESSPLSTGYISPVGMILYSSPESFCGLAGARDIGHLSDVYALGAMLFELFNAEDHYSAVRRLNCDFDARIAALQARIDPTQSDEAKLRLWDREAPRLLRGLTPVDVCRAGTSVPAPVSELLRELVFSMTAANFRNRVPKLTIAREKVRSAMTCLSNEAMAKRKAKEAQKKRLQRRNAAIERANRIRARQQLLTSGGNNGSN